ncbi:MAG: glycosyltransferase [Clostridia bacterium]|nr:glycosyltransferase [Clostridia bacterium]
MSRDKDTGQETMKRIFMVGYSGNKGGVETYIDQLTKALPEYEFVLSLPEMTIDGKNWHRPPNRHHYVSYRLFWHRFFRENRFDAVYYNACDIVSIDMLRFAKRTGVPVRILHSHCTDNQQFINKRRSLPHRVSEQINRRMLDRYATHLLACSENAGKWMFGDRKYTVINNGIDPEKFRYREEARKAIREQYGLGDHLLAGIVGRLSAQKNPAFVLKILKALFQLDPSARAVFAGDGPLRGETIEEARKAGIQDRILFPGAVNNVAEWMSSMDVLLMPSLFEGLPFTLIEAQASGLPCVVSSTVTHEADLTGLVHFVELNKSPEEWAGKLTAYAKQERTDYTAQIVSAGYSIQHTAAQVKTMIESGDTIRD